MRILMDQKEQNFTLCTSFKKRFIGLMGKKNIQDQKERHAAVSAVSPGKGKLNSNHREIYERYEEIPGICIRRRGDREGKTAAVQRMAHGPLLCEQRQFHAGSPEPVPEI